MVDNTIRDVGRMSGDEQAAIAADTVRACLQQLIDQGLPLGPVLAGAHAEIVTLPAAVLGGDEAAKSCLRGADRVRGLPSVAEVALRQMPPAGSC